MRQMAARSGLIKKGVIMDMFRAFGVEKLQADYSKKKVISKVNEKGYRNKPLTTVQKATNHEKSKTRARIEHVFEFVENSMNSSFADALGV